MGGGCKERRGGEAGVRTCSEAVRELASVARVLQLKQWGEFGGWAEKKGATQGYCPIPLLTTHFIAELFFSQRNFFLGSILCVNLTELKDAQVPGETLLLGVSVRVFSEESSICISRSSEEVCPHHCG